MSTAFNPRLDILPEAQRRLWPELEGTPGDFTLYGGTAIALRLGHRQSIDFDFFAQTSFEPDALLTKIPYLKGAVVRQSSPNTLTTTVERNGGVQVSFFGGLGLGQVEAPDFIKDLNLAIASLIDLAGTKAKVIIQRVEPKDYIDIHALMTKGGVRLNAAYLRQSAKTLSREASFDVVRYSMLPRYEADGSQGQTLAKLMKEGSPRVLDALAKLDALILHW